MFTICPRGLFILPWYHMQYSAPTRLWTLFAWVKNLQQFSKKLNTIRKTKRKYIEKLKIFISYYPTHIKLRIKRWNFLWLRERRIEAIKKRCLFYFILVLDFSCWMLRTVLKYSCDSRNFQEKRYDFVKIYHTTNRRRKIWG